MCTVVEVNWIVFCTRSLSQTQTAKQQALLHAIFHLIYYFHFFFKKNEFICQIILHVPQNKALMWNLRISHDELIKFTVESHRSGVVLGMPLCMQVSQFHLFWSVLWCLGSVVFPVPPPPEATEGQLNDELRRPVGWGREPTPHRCMSMMTFDVE